MGLFGRLGSALRAHSDQYHGERKAVLPASIRALKASDAPEVARMVAALSQHEGKPAPHFTPAHVKRDLFGPGAFVRGLIAEAEGKTAGYLLWQPSYDTESGERGGYMIDLFVDPWARRRGIARALMRQAAQGVKQEGGQFLWWSAKSYNIQAISFYRTVGEEERMMTTWASFGPAFQALLD